MLCYSGCDWWFFFAPIFQLFHTLGLSSCHNTFLSSPHPDLIIGLFRDLFIPYTESLIGKKTGNLHADQMFWTTAEAKGEDLDPVKHV